MNNRSRTISLCAALVAAVLLTACTALPVTPAAPAAQAPAVGDSQPAAAPACSGQLTPAQTEGPYYTPDPPEKATLVEDDMGGTRILLTGYVLDTACQPIPGAVVDLWQADADGVYDNTGYRLRGYTLTDAGGRYRMPTILPGEYPGRPPHIHVKIQPPGGEILTTQVYFPGQAANTRDSIFNPALIAEMQTSDEGEVARFDFIVTP